MTNTFPCILEHLEILTSTVRQFRFRPPEGVKLNFQPGQFVVSNMPKEGKNYRKSYSIASPPYEVGSFELCIKLVEGGYASNYYFRMKPGDELPFDGPYGKFMLKESISNLVFLSTGTGIAPFRSMLKQLDHEGKLSNREVWVFSGVRYDGEILYQREFEGLAQQYAPHFHFYPCISRSQNPDWPYKGYVQHFAKQVLKPAPDIDVYICGLIKMVDEVRPVLKDLGFTDEQVHFEKWT